MFTSTPMAPASRSIVSIARATACGSVTSATAATALAPVCSTSSCVSSRASPDRATSPRANPAWASASAVARPMPRLAPVTIATRSVTGSARAGRAARVSRRRCGSRRRGAPIARRSLRRSWRPSDRLSTQRYASSRFVPSGTLWYRPRLPSCGSPFGERLRYVAFVSITSMIRSAVRKDAASASAVTRSRSSAEEWYSGKSPCGVRESVPTGRSNPGEQNCRSSPPVGCHSDRMLVGSPARTCAATRSIGASPRRLRL